MHGVNITNTPILLQCNARILFMLEMRKMYKREVKSGTRSVVAPHHFWRVKLFVIRAGNEAFSLP